VIASRRCNCASQSARDRGITVGGRSAIVSATPRSDLDEFDLTGWFDHFSSKGEDIRRSWRKMPRVPLFNTMGLNKWHGSFGPLWPSGGARSRSRYYLSRTGGAKRNTLMSGGRCAWLTTSPASECVTWTTSLMNPMDSGRASYGGKCVAVRAQRRYEAGAFRPTLKMERAPRTSWSYTVSRWRRAWK
jgi:hypothetical protein